MDKQDLLLSTLSSRANNLLIKGFFPGDLSTEVSDVIELCNLIYNEIESKKEKNKSTEIIAGGKPLSVDTINEAVKVAKGKDRGEAEESKSES
jgi:hypothetical protein